MNEVHPLAADEIRSLDLYWRTANYLGATQIYLWDNYLLEEPLRTEHIKPRLLGHWGTVPGINFIYTHLNRLILRERANVLLLTGPGHGAPMPEESRLDMFGAQWFFQKVIVPKVDLRS